MELRKTSENINRSYNAEGQATERVDNIQYEIVGDDGQAVGTASIGQGWASAIINASGFASIEEGEQKIKQILGIEG